jgi:hypothetical protein
MQRAYILIDKVQATIPRHESTDFLAVLDQLHANALSNSRIRLFGFNAAKSFKGEEAREKPPHHTRSAYTRSTTIPLACDAPWNGLAFSQPPQ